MNQKWLFSAALLLMAGCGVENPAPTANKCKDCGPEKCYRTIMVPITEEVKYTDFKSVEKDCTVSTVKSKTKKVPVKTYRYVDEWVDTPVQEAYTEKVTVRKPRKVTLTEKYLDFAPVSKQVDGMVDCGKKIVKTDWKCEHKSDTINIKQCGVCGETEKIKATREYSVPKRECTESIEMAQCPGKVTEVSDEPVIKERKVEREGYYTDTAEVVKYRIVPGKKLIRKRVCETVMADLPDSTVETTNVKRTVSEPVEKTRKITKMVEKKIEIDCQTGAEVTAKQEIKKEEESIDIKALAEKAGQ